MPTQKRLAPEDHAFFSGLADLIFSNPFADNRERVAALTDRRPATDTSGEHAFSAMAPVLDQRIQAIEAQGIHSLEALIPEQREVLRYGFLFQLYNRFVERFDGLIRKQIRGGDEPVPAPFGVELLEAMQRRGLGTEESRRYIALLFQLRRAFYFIGRSLVGQSPSMGRLRHALWNNVFTRDARIYEHNLWDRMEDFSTLLLGETGTGKGTAAAAIGRSGLIPFDPERGRFRYSFTAAFIGANLSQFPESLIESELFGHRKGAFTGAIDHHKGIFERCSPYGALFLDEIGEVSIPVQIKLLNVLQDREFAPVGSHQRQRFAGRVIAATNQPLERLLAEGRFRHDFFYRLSSDVIEVPPLRTRIQEAPAELERLVGLLVERTTGTADAGLADEIHHKLQAQLPADYPWPGNVRELEQAVRRILLKGEYLGALSAGEDRHHWLAKAREGELTAQELTAAYCAMLYRQYGTYEEVAKRTDLDRRTAKKYVLQNEDRGGW